MTKNEGVDKDFDVKKVSGIGPDIATNNGRIIENPFH